MVHKKGRSERVSPHTDHAAENGDAYVSEIAERKTITDRKPMAICEIEALPCAGDDVIDGQSA
jgi:hypothetical protein